jgi:succinyl-diaminopimelate desuccinylase
MNRKKSHTFVTQIREYIHRMRDEIIEFTSRLIRVPTVNPPGVRYEECVQILGEKLSQLGIEWRKVSVPEERLPELAPKGEGFIRPSIIGTWGEGEKGVHLHGHYDVVPALSEDQFHPYVSSGKLYGRGSTDMKAGLAVILFALQALKESGAHPEGAISLSFTPDEETGGAAGLKYLLDEGYVNRNVIGVIDPEPSSGHIINGCKGALSLDVIVKGKPSHVMIQHKGVNAFEKMIEVAREFMALKNRVEGRKTGHKVTPPDADRSVLLMGGVCGGGTNFNIVPDRVFFSIDRRFNPEENIADVKREIDETISVLKKKGIEVETRVFQEGNASLTEEHETVCQVLANSVERVTGRRPDVSLCPGLLETRFFVDVGIPAVIYGPGLVEEAHGPKEYVIVEDVLSCTEIYAVTVLDLLRE